MWPAPAGVILRTWILGFPVDRDFTQMTKRSPACRRLALAVVMPVAPTVAKAPLALRVDVAALCARGVALACVTVALTHIATTTNRATGIARWLRARWRGPASCRSVHSRPWQRHEAG